MSKASPGSLAAHLNDFVFTAKDLRKLLARRLAARRGARDLSRLDEFMLKDIGLTRADIFSAVHGKVHRRD
ncbi:MAG: DUF1127 domain-containing protein [Parvibaculaceae bacterium]